MNWPKTQIIWLIPLCAIAIALDLFFRLPAQDSLNFNSTFFEFRFPRVLAAILGGATLSLAGLIMQTLFRNPLAGPFLVGITPGATFGMAVNLFLFRELQQLGIDFMGNSIVASVIGALLALLLQLSLNRGFENTTRLLLTGMVLSFLFSAGTDLLQTIGDLETIKQFTFWGMGSFERVTLDQIPILVPPLMAGILIVLGNRFKMDAYLLGDLYAQSSGVAIRNLRILMILSGAILAGIITAYCGPVSFVGLVAPHIAKRLLGSESHSKTLLPSILWGIFLCVSADCIAHNLISGITLQINAIMALIGAPILIGSFSRKLTR